MRQGIVLLCRMTTRVVVINLTALGLTFLGLGLFGLLPAIAAAGAASAKPRETPIPRLARAMVAEWRHALIRVNAVGLPLVAASAVAVVLLPVVAGPIGRAVLLAVVYAGVAGALTTASLAARNDGRAAALARALARLWLERPWLPPLLPLVWALAALLPVVHPLLGLYAAISLAASACDRLVAGASANASLSPLGQGVPS